MSQGQVAPQGNPMAVSALVLGIIGVLVSWIPCVGWFLGLLLGVLAVIFGFVGKGRAAEGAPYGGAAIAGLACGVLALVIAVGVPLAGFLVAKKAIDQQGGLEGIIKKAQDETQRQVDEAARRIEQQQKATDIQIEDERRKPGAKQSDQGVPGATTPKPAGPSRESPPKNDSPP